jgi:hypothetical protein
VNVNILSYDGHKEPKHVVKSTVKSKITNVATVRYFAVISYECNVDRNVLQKKKMKQQQCW